MGIQLEVFMSNGWISKVPVEEGGREGELVIQRFKFL